MEQKQKDSSTDYGDIYSMWMQSATNFWNNMIKMHGEMPDFSGFMDRQKKGSIHNTQKNFASAFRIYQALAMVFSKPENLEALFKGSDGIPDFMMEVIQQSVGGSMDLQKKMLEHLLKLTRQGKTYDFSDMDPEFFESLKSIYENEFQKIFNIPQLGLNRFHQERLNVVMDKYILYHYALLEFIYTFYVPVEKSLGAMQDKIEGMIHDDGLNENYKEYYAMWIKTLEGYYMQLLGSREYTCAMNKTINALAEYREARDELLYDVLQVLPIPTNKEMDELYRDIYKLKKKVKELSKALKKKE